MSLQYYLENGESEMHSARYPKRLNIFADISGPSATRQEFADECDVNQIMSRYEKSGVWPMQPNGVEPIYYDFTEVPDLIGAMATMIDAEAAFMRLPAVVRKEFDNDAMRFVEFASVGDNVGKLREWGLAEPEKAPEKPIEVRIIPDPAAPPIVPAAGG